MQEDLEDPEKELGQEGKKALKRDAETLGTSRKPNKSKLEKFLEMSCDILDRMRKVNHSLHKQSYFANISYHAIRSHR